MELRIKLSGIRKMSEQVPAVDRPSSILSTTANGVLAAYDELGLCGLEMQLLALMGALRGYPVTSISEYIHVNAQECLGIVREMLKTQEKDLA